MLLKVHKQPIKEYERPFEGNEYRCEITPNGIIDQLMTFDEYIKSERIKQLRDALYGSLKPA